MSREAEGRYEPGAELGRGGMGVVVEAVDRHLGRAVARKELRPGRVAGPHPSLDRLLGAALDDDDAAHVARCGACRVERRLAGLPVPAGAPAPPLARFVREARLTAQLEHPAIVPVYELALGADGAPYYTMREVNGRSLAAVVADAPDLAARLALLGHVVAVAQGVAYAHSRGVVHRDLKPENVMIGAFGEAVIVDWGIAAVAGEASEGEVAPSFGPPDRTGTGAVLGTPAYMAPEAARGERVTPAADVYGLGAILYEVVTGQPPWAGVGRDAALAALRAGRVPSVAAHPEVPKELAAIVSRALAPDPEVRYPSASSLAQELETWRTGGRVAAYSYSTRELVGRLISRHRAPVTVACVALLALGALALTAYARVERERAQAVAARDEARLSLAAAYTGKALAAAETHPVEARLYAAAALELAESADARGVLARFGRGWMPSLRAVVPAPGGCLSLDALGTAVACGGPDGLSWWDVAEAPIARRVTDGRAAQVAIGGGGAWVAVTQRDRGVVIVDPATGAITQQMGRRGAMRGLDAEGDLVAFSSANSVRVEDVTRARAAWTTALPARAGKVALAPAGVALAASYDGGLSVWHAEAEGWWETASVPHGGVTSLAFSPDGSRLAVGRADGSLELLAAADLTPSAPSIDAHDQPVTALVWLGDGRVATGSAGHSAAIWSADTGEQVVRLPLADGRAAPVAGLPGGELLVGGLSSAVTWWGEPSWGGWSALPLGGALTGVGRVGDRVVAGTADGALRLAPVTGGEAAEVRVGPHAVRAVATAGGAAAVAAGSAEVLWVRSDGITRVAAPRGVLAAAPLADGGLARAFQDGVIEVVRGGVVVRRLVGPTDPVALSADAAGRRLAVVARGDHQAVFDLTDGRAWRLPIDPPPRAAALSPDGRWLAVSDREAPTVTVWDVDAGVPVRTLDGHDQTVAAVAWSADGGWLATASGDRTARVWDAADGRVLAVLRGHTRHVSDVAFVGSELWTAGGDGDVRAWDLASLQQDPAAAMAAATSTGSCLYRGAVGPCGSP